ncbi:hypothetical protein HX867_03590 [Pseudomonas gingeri]|uniref:hypothetical protein n=1 Tax=Pseudomonas gingeri TaxID=117681 RepID=UPI0015A06DE8|nr:hypothetical protein [Pseudomonas gingeri]NVZ61159.1 hypothetical protein [Pseudomonas gingeri]NVZ79270.1 hypothetical protein [Pseudomonas gingeri]
MLVNARNQTHAIQPSNRSDLDPTTAANNALSSGFVQSAQAAAGLTSAPSAQNAANKAADKVADNVNAAFAKTRVHLQAKVPDVAAAATMTATPPTTRTAPTATSNDSDAMKEFKDYMSKSPVERLREQMLKEQGLTEESFNALPPEQQQAINNKIAERIKEQFSAQTDKNSPNPVDKQAASAFLATNN